MKRVICFFIALVMMVSLISACGTEKTATSTKTASVSTSTATTTTPAPTQKVTIKMEGISSPTYTAQFWEEYKNTIEKDNAGVTIEMILAPGTDRAVWIKSKYAAGDAPDILTADCETFSNVEGAYSEVPAELLSNIQDSAISKVNGKVVVLPASLQIKSQAYYNKKMFEEAGIQEVPKTWSAFVEACAKLKAKDFAPLMGSKEAWFDAFGYATAVLQPDVIDANPNFLSDLKTGKEKWNNTAMSDSLKRFQDLTTKGYWYKGSNSFAYSQSVDEFFKGAAAIIFNGSWMAPQIDGLEQKPDFEIGIFPIPQVTGVKSIGATTGTWAVLGKSKVVDEAWKVVKYCIVDNTELYKKYLQNDNLLSITKTPITYESTPMVAAFNKSIEGLKPVMDFPGLSGDDALPAGYGDFYNNSIQSIYIGKDISKTLDAMDQEYQKLINK